MRTFILTQLFDANDICVIVIIIIIVIIIVVVVVFVADIAWVVAGVIIGVW